MDAKRPRHVRVLSEKPVGDVIQCHDCHILGFIAYRQNGSYTISKGWKMADWDLYICPKCQEKRRNLFLRQE